jgi:adenylylsulfate kinase
MAEAGAIWSRHQTNDTGPAVGDHEENILSNGPAFLARRRDKPTRKFTFRIEYRPAPGGHAELNTDNLVWHPTLVTREQREAANGHKAAVVWFTGLPSSGKSTIAHEAESRLFRSGHQAYVLDGDNIRHGLSADLGFSGADRAEHLRRSGELAKLLYGSGMIALCAFVSPTRSSRARARELGPAGGFFEIYCRCPREVCERRDPKGFYARARAGTLSEYTGVSAPYEEPVHPELLLDTNALSPDLCADRVMALLEERGVIAGRPAAAASGKRAPA